MSGNANFTPLGPIRRWPRDESDIAQAQPMATRITTSTIVGELAPIPEQQIGIQGEVLARVTPLVTGACTKCGYVGHLPFQCRNFIQIKPNQKTDIDISSTSSEEYTTPLTSKEERKKLKKMKKKQKKEMKKLEKKLKEELKKKSRKRRRHSSSSSSSSIYSVSSADERKKKRTGKAKKADKKSKKEKRRTRSRS